MKHRKRIRSKGGRRFKHNIRDREHLERVRRRPCRIGNSECWGPTAPHHEPPLSRGGDDHHVAPLCLVHHEIRGALGPKRFNEKYDIDLEAEAVRTYAGEDFVKETV